MKLRRWLCAAFLPFLLSACGGDDTVGVPVSGINYTDQGFGAYGLKDPNDEKNYGGGEPLGPYAAGGMMCCYSLPEQWHEGMQVEVIIRRAMVGETYEDRTAEYARRRDNGTLDETILVDIPPYDAEDIQHSAIWVEMLPDNRFDVVVSHVDPNHKDWPGDIKGWPVPSVEYRKKLARERLPDVEADLALFSSDLEKIRQGDEEVLKACWEVKKKSNSEDVDKYSSYLDPEFKAYSVERLEWRVGEIRKKVDRLKEIIR